MTERKSELDEAIEMAAKKIKAHFRLLGQISEDF